MAFVFFMIISYFLSNYLSTPVGILMFSTDAPRVSIPIVAIEIATTIDTPLNSRKTPVTPTEFKSAATAYGARIPLTRPIALPNQSLSI